MSLHDVDKNSADRGAPAPNRPDVVADDATMAHKTVSTQYRTGADATAGQVQMANKQLVANDGTANKALFGFQKGLGKWGMFVAVDGVDVTTNTDLSQFILNSAQDTFKIAAKLSQDFTFTSGSSTAGSTTFTIIHNLGYVPLIMPTVNITTLTNGNPGIYPIPFITPGVGGGTTNVFVILSYLRVRSVTSTTITFELGIQASTQTFAGTVTCYVLQETSS